MFLSPLIHGVVVMFKGRRWLRTVAALTVLAFFFASLPGVAAFGHPPRSSQSWAAHDPSHDGCHCCAGHGAQTADPNPCCPGDLEESNDSPVPAVESLHEGQPPAGPCAPCCPFGCCWCCVAKVPGCLPTLTGFHAPAPCMGPNCMDDSIILPLPPSAELMRPPRF